MPGLPRPRTGGGGGWGGSAGTHAAGLRTLAVLLGIFFIGQSMLKIGWLLDSSALGEQLRGWLDGAHASSRWYIETVALPGLPIFARVVPLGELAAGVALILGARVRIAAALALLMVLNFHFANGQIFNLVPYVANGFGPPVIGGLLALTIGGVRLPFSVTR